jgi:hypothetical protein
VRRGRGEWSNWQVATLLMACAAGLYAVSVIIILVHR